MLQVIKKINSLGVIIQSPEEKEVFQEEGMITDERYITNKA